MSGLRAALALLTTLPLVLVVVSSTPASASINRAAAVAYADKWALGRNTAQYPKSGSIGDDCTDFASQVEAAGGWPQQNPFAVFPWYMASSAYSRSWTVVADFVQSMQDNGYAGNLKQIPAPLAANYTSALGADVYVYDWGKGLGISHTSVEVGYGTRDPQYAADGNGDYVDQHVTDRHHSPWNYGYLHPDSNTNISQMKVYILPMRY